MKTPGRTPQSSAKPAPRPAAEAGLFPLGRAHEQFLASIIESAEDAIFAKTLDGTILSWNAGAERMYGYTASEIVGEHVHRLAPPDRHSEIAQILERIRSGARVEHFGTERVRKNGVRFPVSLSISPVTDASGRIVGASTIARDTSEQRRLAEAADFQRMLLAAESDASIDGILVVDLGGRIISTNRRLREQWGLAEDALDGATDDALLAAVQKLARHPAAFVDRFRRLHARTKEQSRDELRLVDGRVFDSYTAPLIGDDRLYGRVWYFRDITTETIRLAQLRAVISAVEDAAIVFDAEGRAVLRNPAAYRLIPGVEYETDLMALLGQPGPKEAGRPRRLPTGTTEAEYHLDVDEQDRFVRLSKRPIVVDAEQQRRPGGSPPEDRVPALGSLVLIRDMTELRDVESSREAFVGLLSHELRTPITTILGAAKVLQGGRAGPTGEELLSDIEAEADRLYRLIEDMLVLTRIEREELELAQEPTLVGPILSRVVAAEQKRVPGARLELAVERSMPMVRGEETYIEQIVRNLIGNAIKYGPRGGLVRIQAESSGSGAAIRVLDEGPGIAGDETDLVFELLYRSPASAAQAAGSGIGLFVSRRLAQAMGGSITARSRPEGGAEFVVELAGYEIEAEQA